MNDKLRLEQAKLMAIKLRTLANVLETEADNHE